MTPTTNYEVLFLFFVSGSKTPDSFQNRQNAKTTSKTEKRSKKKSQQRCGAPQQQQQQKKEGKRERERERERERKRRNSDERGAAIVVHIASSPKPYLKGESDDPVKALVGCNAPDSVPG
jgi:hypothetical protein